MDPTKTPVIPSAGTCLLGDSGKMQRQINSWFADAYSRDSVEQFSTAEIGASVM